MTDLVGEAAAAATAAFTGLLVVVGYFQIGGQLRKVSSQLDANLKALQLEEAELRLAPQRREEYRARRSQAEQVQLERRDGVDLVVHTTKPSSYSYLAVTNRSGRPVTAVDVLFGDKWAFDTGQLDLAAPEPRQLQNGRRETLDEIGPGETWYFLIYTTYRIQVADSEVWAFFTNVNGVQWRKNLIGQLVEIPPPKPGRPGVDLSE